MEQRKNSIRLLGYDYSSPGAYFVTLVTNDRLRIFGDIVDGRLHLSKIGKIAHLEWEWLPFHFPGIKTGEFVVMPNHIHCIVHIVENQVRATLQGPQRNTNDEIIGRRGILPLDGGSPQRESSSQDGSPQQESASQDGSPQSESSSQVRATLQDPQGNTNDEIIGWRGILSLDNGSPQRVSSNVDGSLQPVKGPKPGSIGAIISQYKSRVTKRIWRDQKWNKKEIWQRNYFEHIIRDQEEYNRIVQYILDNPLNWLKDEKNK